MTYIKSSASQGANSSARRNGASFVGSLLGNPAILSCESAIKDLPVLGGPAIPVLGCRDRLTLIASVWALLRTNALFL